MNSPRPFSVPFSVRCKAVLALAATSLAILAFPAAAQDQRRIEQTWIETLDAKGRVAEITPEDLSIVDDGRSVEASITQGLGTTQVAIYVDRYLSSNATVRRATAALGRQAQRLTDLGEVDLVIADDEAISALASDDPFVLQERLSWTSVNDSGRRSLLALREQALSDLRKEEATAEEQAAIAVAAIAEEVRLIRRQRDLLLAWAARNPVPGGGLGVLFLVQDGFDLNPQDFYGRHLPEEAHRIVIRDAFDALRLDRETREAAAALAARDWIVLPFALGDAADAEDGLEWASSQTEDQTGARAGGVGIKFRFGGKNKEEAAEAPAPAARFVDSVAALRRFAEISGGELLRGDSGLDDALKRLPQRFRLLWYASPSSDEPRPIQISPSGDDGLRLRAASVRGDGIPEAMAAAQLRRLMTGKPLEAPLDVAAVLHLDDSDAGDATPTSGRVEARVTLGEVAEDEVSFENATFRVTTAIATEDGTTEIRREIVPEQRLEGLIDWLYAREIELPPGAVDAAVLVEATEPGSGEQNVWGGARASVNFSSAAASVLAPAVIALERPDEEILRGRVRFNTRVFDNRVERVEFLLGDRVVQTARKEPFSARIDLGRSPRRQTLAAVAYDTLGAELGRDTVVLNAGSGGLDVEILRRSSLRGSLPGGRGPIDVEAAVAIPVERTLDRVLFFYNNEAVATLYGPPYRARIDVPENQSLGYVRVVAMLDDGTLAEDVAFLDDSVPGEDVDVNLVELYVVVTGEDGRPVRGLLESDFSVREERREQTLASFSDASDLPITLGMTIDSSASMFVKLPVIQQEAIRFLRSTFTEEDRAFVVDFDSQPRLARSTTYDLDAVVRSIERLKADGRTALWESIVYSLVQLQGVRGRKALVVFSDGADEDDQFPYDSCYKFARKIGVPIYLILMKRQPAEGAGLSLFSRSFTSRVDKLVSTTGGRVFYAKEYENLAAVYDEIEYELRSQYLLTYYPDAPQRGSVWRDVAVEVLKGGLTPRTLAGYWN